MSILLPSQASATSSNASVPTGIQLVYTAVISTTYGTLSLAPVVYLWDFGDGTTRETSNVMVSHSYNYADTYLLTLSVQTPSSPSHTESYLLSTYKSKPFLLLQAIYLLGTYNSKPILLHSLHNCLSDVGNCRQSK